MTVWERLVSSDPPPRWLKDECGALISNSLSIDPAWHYGRRSPRLIPGVLSIPNGSEALVRIRIAESQVTTWSSASRVPI